MARNFVADTYEFFNSLIEEGSGYFVNDVRFGKDASNDSFIEFELVNAGGDKMLQRVMFYVNQGTICRKTSVDGGLNWTTNQGTASATKYGAVKVSDDYNASGAASAGLVPSQKALHDATVVNTITLTAGSDVSGMSYEACRTGNIVEGIATFQIASGLSQGEHNVLTGLPLQKLSQSGMRIPVLTADNDPDPNNARFILKKETQGSNSKLVVYLPANASAASHYTVRFSYIAG